MADAVAFAFRPDAFRH